MHPAPPPPGRYPSYESRYQDAESSSSLQRSASLQSQMSGGRPNYPPPFDGPTRSETLTYPQRPEENGDKAGKKRARADSLDKSDKSKKDTPEGKDLPAVLIREKKQKACANCRKAKLKCIVETGEKECVRCKARSERCVFYPRSHDEDWQQTLTTDVYSALSHLSTLSSAVHHLLYHLSAQHIIPPFQAENGELLDRYEPPDRDMAVLQGWGAEKNKDLGKGKRKKKEDEDEDEDEPLQKRRSSSISMPFPNGMAQLPRFPGNGYPLPHHSMPERFAQELPPFRPQPPGQIQLTPTSELDIAPNYYQISPHNGPHGLLSQVAGIGTLAPHSLSPAQHVTPSSIANSSPAVEGPPFSDHYSLPMQSPKVVVRPQPPLFPENLYEDEDIPPGTIIGSKDNRADVITKGIVRPNEAIILVKYFHRHLAPFLFGYRLRFGHFPYLIEGPALTTPLIFGVLCLLASERLPEFEHLHPRLAEHVTQLLLSNPAESWFSLADAKKNQKEKAVVGDGEDQLDPELGIGPEEIIGATVVSMYMTARDQAAQIAESAFRWARGWIKMLCGPPRNSIAELMAFVPTERHASPQDMARVWLLCYIVEGTNVIMDDASSRSDAGFDPERNCETLLPSDSDAPSAYDLVLTSQAKLVHLLRNWKHQYTQLEHSASGAELAKQVHNLTRQTNSALEWWQEELSAHSLPFAMSRESWLFWQFARAIVNDKGAEALSGQPRLRGQALKDSVDGAIGFLEICSKWEPQEELTNLPHNFLNMIGHLVRVVRQSVEHNACPIDPIHAANLLRSVGAMLHLGGLPKFHHTRYSGDSCFQAADQLAGLGLSR